MTDTIKIKGVRANNLKDISLEIPHGKLVVVTGLSGSGKSSLAFDTLYAEGQRRYVESLSSYARQFMGRMNKPECDYIKGLPPAIAIEQRVSSRNPRSTVGTSTEIYEYLRLLFARIGRTYSPISGVEVKRHTTEDVVQCMQTLPQGTKLMVLCPIHLPEDRDIATQLDMYRQSGFARVECDGEVLRIEDFLASPTPFKEINLVVDRLTAGTDRESISRLTDSAETAFYEGHGELLLRILPSGEAHSFSTLFQADGINFEEPTDQLFAFNSPIGACPECEGFGKIIGIDEQQVIPNSTLSIYEGAVMCWRGEKLSEWKEWFIRFNSERGFPIFKPYYQLSQEEKDWLWHGTFPSTLTAAQRRLTPEEEQWGLISIDAFFEMLRQGQYKIQNRVMLARYRGRTLCPACHGTRLRPEASYVRVYNHSITQLVDIPISELKAWIDTLDSHLTTQEQQISHRIQTEIKNRLQFLLDVGLGYLTLNRPSSTLSGGESQRIRLATSLGSSLVGSLYILDEPSIGLHSRDTNRLIHVLQQLRDQGNTVLVVEHDEDIMRAADWLIDIGPDAGRMGGQIVYSGPPQSHLEQVQTALPSHTLDYLTGRKQIPVPTSRRPWTSYIEVLGARAHNLKGIDVRFPLCAITCVTGVSGSGKSSLVSDILYPALKRQLDQVADRPGEHLALGGDLQMVKAVEYVDQNPIGRSTRSNPVTYLRAWDEIRRLMASLPLAKQMGFTPGHFSFNTEGGRCEECRGEGTVTVEMQFMADLILECESCHGQRFKSEILEVRFQGQNVHDILRMTVRQAIEFFQTHGQSKICALLQPLQDVGLGYIRLGQSSSTLSGGENQRVKLAYYLGMERQLPTVFIFDEPTTGLHFHDIDCLLHALEALVARGHTVIIVEHHPEVIKCADWVIDLGPEGGEQGGQVLCQGTPEQIALCPQSSTGQFLKDKMKIV